MRVIICGAGLVGYGIAERLAAENNDVTIIDTSDSRIQSVRDSLDVKGVVGHGAHPDILATAGAADADMIIAATLFDEVNMVACQVAHSLFDVPTKIARVRDQSYLDKQRGNLFARDHLPIDVIISPELEVGEMILRRLALPGAAETVLFGDGEAILIGIECREDCPVIDTPLSQLTELFPDLGAVVVAIVRDGKLFVPRSSDNMLAGDLSYVIAQHDQVRRTLSIFGHDEQEVRRVIIAGGGNIGRYVARRMEELRPNTRVMVIESNRDQAISIAEDLKKSVVLHGDVLDAEILREADVASADTVVALTNNDEVNILGCVIAKQQGGASTMALVNNPTYPAFANSLNIDAYINPRSVTISKILQHVRRGRIRGVYTLHQGAGEVIEAEALETSPMVGKTLRELDMPDGIRIGLVIRTGESFPPSGDTIVQAGDRVILFARSDSVNLVEQLFRVSLEFF
jgi:trk system potassium uptake protein TrkA